MKRFAPAIMLLIAVAAVAQTTAPTTQPAMQYQTYAYATTNRKPSFRVTLANGWHAGGPIVIAVDDVKSFSPSITTSQVPVLDADGKPVIDPATKKPKTFTRYAYQTRIEVTNGAYFVAEEFHEVGRILKKAGWGNVVPLTRYVHPLDEGGR